MKSFQKIVLMTVVFVIALAFNALAQNKKPEKTSSARAYYGAPPAKTNYKYKKKKKSHSLFGGQVAKRNRKKYSS